MENPKLPNKFTLRHTGIAISELPEMLQDVGVKDIEELILDTVPSNIRMNKNLNIGEGMTEYEYLEYIRSVAKKNIVAKSYIGMGYYTTIVPSVIQRNILENPGWYTQYTPYQAEISQGRLEALMNFQTMIADLTGLPVANASLLDEATSAAEAMIMLFNHSRSQKYGNKFLVDKKCFPQTVDVLRTRSAPLGIELIISDLENLPGDKSVFGLIVQNPDNFGRLLDLTNLLNKAKSAGIFTVVAADLMSLALITPPGELGADVCIGSTQRFGIPMGFGGPHAGYFATKDDFKRVMPGRIIGASVDANGKLAYRMALQTREQHIKREKATSNICTSQVLLAIMAGMYAVYHGPEGIKEIASTISQLTGLLAENLKSLGFEQLNDYYFDTLYLSIKDQKMFNALRELAEKRRINLRYFNNCHVGISLGETDNIKSVKELADLFKDLSGSESEFSTNAPETIPDILKRKTAFLKNETFGKYHCETEMMRYLKKLENKDLSLTLSMIPLGSCTMKLNAASELYPITFPEFTDIHPHAPESQTAGYGEVVSELGAYLNEITGFKACSFQPNSGAQGEYAGLMTIRNYFISTGQQHRNICLIPSSAHGTNPASAVMAGMKVIVVNCDEKGNIDTSDLAQKASQYKDNLAALLVTYPSTHGVFESAIIDICRTIHENGGMVYMDGANMNAQVGLTQPALLGADVCHINLHKTFAIPHGGGGPGMGPICVSEKLAPYLPGYFTDSDSSDRFSAVSAAKYGSALVLLISLGYIKMCGADGLKYATKIAILNANYLKSKLEKYYKVLYTGENGRVAHEMIFDMREFKKTANIEVEDIAKRLMDYGFHAPTVSFPVAGTLMVEPTESESKYELDRFIEAMISIRKEIMDIETGNCDQKDNVLKNAPHTAECIAADKWEHSYGREAAAFPVKSLREYKFWPSVARVNNAYGDRNLICSCNDISAYIEPAK